MLIGPVFNREFVTSPRRPQFYIGRAGYALILLILITTASMLMSGHRSIRNIGEMALFGEMIFQFLAPLQLTLALIFSAIFAVGAIAQEKDRRTLVLLLMTRLSNAEIVLGKLFASMLNVYVLLAAAFPVFMLLMLFGGISPLHVARVFGITVVTAFAAGSLGGLFALWREKTFQAFALTFLVLMFWLAGWEAVYQGMLGKTVWGINTHILACCFHPFRAIEMASIEGWELSEIATIVGHPTNGFLVIVFALGLLLNLISTLGVRRWNSVGSIQQEEAKEDSRGTIWTQTETTTSEELAESTSASNVTQKTESKSSTTKQPTLQPAKQLKPYRHVWDNPILWRELRTWAYGKKMIVVRLAFLLLASCSGYGIYYFTQTEEGFTRDLAALIVAPFLVLSLLLLNAQAVTSFCSERDGRTLDLLLAADLTPSQIIFGKLIGAFYNAKEILICALVLCGTLLFLQDPNDLQPILSIEVFAYLLIGFAILLCFAVVLGIYLGMNYLSSRTAILLSLGTVIFLFIGVFTCIRMIITFSGSFELQLYPFLAFMLGGGVGLYQVLGARNPSKAILLTSFVAPVATFYAITSFLLEQTLSVFLVMSFTYGFATVAMLVPAISEFDVVLGRSTAEDGE